MFAVTKGGQGKEKIYRIEEKNGTLTVTSIAWLQPQKAIRSDNSARQYT